MNGKGIRSTHTSDFGVRIGPESGDSHVSSGSAVVEELRYGEGTARQLLRYSTGLDVAAIFITHVHGDHVLGLPGQLRTMEFYDRSTPLDVFTPTYTGAHIEELADAPGVSTTFPVEVTEVEGGERIVDTGGRRVEAFETEHRTSSVGFRIVEFAGSEEECRLLYTGDTRPTESTVSAATGADLLVHDGMFEKSEADRARQTAHSVL